LSFVPGLLHAKSEKRHYHAVRPSVEGVKPYICIILFKQAFLTFQHAAAFFHKLFRRRLDFNAAVPPDPIHAQNLLPAVDQALPD
jgi:hypothetical protein